MAVSFIAATGDHGVNPALPAGAGDQANDFLVLAVGNTLETGGPYVFTFTVPGYTQVSQDNELYVGSGTGRTLGLSVFVAPASVGAPSISASHSGWVAALGAYRDVNLSNPVEGPGDLLGPESGATPRLIPSPGFAESGAMIVGALFVGDNVGAPNWGGNPPNEPPGTNAVTVQEVTGANSSIHQGYRAGIDGDPVQEAWRLGYVRFEPEPPTVELEFLVNWSVVDQGIARALLLRPA